MRNSSILVKASWAVLGVVVLLAVLGPWIAPYDPTVGEMGDALASPSAAHWLGTDYLGRDVLSRLIDGAQVSTIAGLEATAVALALGGGVGVIVGLLGGWADRISMRIIEGISAIPGIVLAIALIAALGTGLFQSMLAVGIAFAMNVARLARGLTMTERERLYVDGARVIGADRRRILRRHIIPNIAAPMGVEATLVFAHAVIIEAALSFLGLGTQPPAASWGSMLATAQRNINQAPFQAIPPGLALVLTVLAINIVGDSLVRRRKGVDLDNPAGYLEPIALQRVTTTEGADPTSSNRTTAEVNGRAPARSLLEVRRLTVRYGDVVAVNEADLTIGQGEVVALVGESGSGKTSVAMALAGLLTPPATATADSVQFALAEPLDLAGADKSGMTAWRSHVGVVFQEPSAALNPLQTVGRQLRDVIIAQRRLADAEDSTAGSEVDDEIRELLTSVGLPRPDEVARLRPGQISGGMAQRVMIALALAKSPALLIADEPTTALDVTVQSEIIRLLRQLCEERSFGVLLVTHDLGVAGELADRVVVMLRGDVVEAGSTEAVIHRPQHDYTTALVAAVPRNEPGRAILHPLSESREAVTAQEASQ